MNISLLDLKAQYQQIKPEIDAAIQQVLESGAYIMGPSVRQFEQHMEEYLGVKHAIGVASGSDALLLSLHALSIGPDDKVIVPTFTFFATASAVTRLGAVPVFVDIDPDTYNLDLNQVAVLCEKDPAVKAIIPVHVFGRPVDMDALMGIAKKYELLVVEDACQAIGASVKGQKVGTIGHTGCFSFFPSKNLGGYGDGGMITTNDDELAEQLRVLRVHGSKPKYYHQVMGYNSRLDTIQAAILDIKLKYLDEWTTGRRLVAGWYEQEILHAVQDDECQSLIRYPKVTDGHVFHQYVIEVENRDKLIQHLNEQGIGTAIYYPHPLHLQQCFAGLGYRPGDLPIAENVCKHVLALPIDPGLTERQIEYVVRCLIGEL